MLRKLLLGLGLFFSVIAVSFADKAPAADVPADVKKRLGQVIPGVKLDNISSTPLPGLYQVNFQGRVLYISEDGRYVLQGDIYDRETSTNLTEKSRSKMRLVAMEKFDDSTAVVFSPKKPKYSITVFTDTTCGFCRKIHQEVPALNKEGVKVRYMLYPRAGIGSPSYKTLESIWCADDKLDAMNVAKSGGSIPEKSCKNPIAEHMQLAQQFGLRGTPMIVTGKGTVINGYQPADQLLTILASESK